MDQAIKPKMSSNSFLGEGIDLLEKIESWNSDEPPLNGLRKEPKKLRSELWLATEVGTNPVTDVSLGCSNDRQNYLLGIF